MPIVDDEAIDNVVVQPAPVAIAAPQYRGVVVDTQYTPLSNLMTHVEGSSWTVNYYSQVLNDDNQVQGQQPNLDPIYQQYTLIRGFELKVTSPLTTSQDTETMSMSLTGSANVYPMVIPNIGDMFLADIGDGREGIFKITNSERRSIFKDTVHFIEYVLVNYSTEELRGDLNQKVIRTVHFVKDFLQYGQNPLLEEEDFHIAAKLASRYHELCDQYFRSFTSTEFRTLIAPGQTFPCYDPFLTKAVRSWFTTWDAPELRSMRTMNTQDDKALDSLTVWDILTKRQPKLLKSTARKMALVSAKTFERNPMMEGIYWTGITYVVHPTDPTINVNFESVAYKKAPAEAVLVDVPSPITNLSDLLDQPALDGLPFEGAPLLHPVLGDACYVFSQAFYDKAATGQSKLELAVWDYLEGKAPNNKLLLTLCDTYHAWGGLERFYYMPIVLLLIKASIRSL